MNEPTMRDIERAARWCSHHDPNPGGGIVASLACLIATVRADERDRCARACDAGGGLGGIHCAAKLRALPPGEDDPQPTAPNGGADGE
jgi:hypothetical protein